MAIAKKTNEKVKIDVNRNNLKIEEFSKALSNFNDKILDKGVDPDQRELLAKKTFDLKSAGNDFQYSRNETQGAKSNQPYNKADGFKHWVGEIATAAEKIQNNNGQNVDPNTAKAISDSFKSIGDRLEKISGNMKNNTENFGKGNDYNVVKMDSDTGKNRTREIFDKTKPSMSLQSELTSLIKEANKLKELSQKVGKEATVGQAPAKPKKAPKAKSQPTKNIQEKKSVAAPSKETAATKKVNYNTPEIEAEVKKIWGPDPRARSNANAPRAKVSSAKPQEQAYKNAPFTLKTSPTPKREAPSKNLIASLEPIKKSASKQAPQKQSVSTSAKKPQPTRQPTAQTQTRDASARQNPSISQSTSQKQNTAPTAARDNKTGQSTSRRTAPQVPIKGASVRQGQTNRPPTPQAGTSRTPNVETRLQRAPNAGPANKTQGVSNNRPPNSPAPVSKAMTQAINNKRNAAPFPPKVADLASQATRGVKSLQVAATQPKGNQPGSPGVTKVPPPSNKRQV